tara:strand:+ start:578 stop:904 length:327 start_codon:yes stop_codon:yes gene_type:complete
MFINYASKNTPVTGSHWINLSDTQRLNAIKEIINNNDSFKNISINRAHENGQVFVTLSEDVSVAQRGGLLLDFEEHIKIKLDEGLNVWCEPIGDKNSLRKLRGIQIRM